MNFKLLSLAVSATTIAAAAAYFITVPPVQSEPRSASEFGGETSMNWYIPPADYAYRPIYQYSPSVFAPANWVVPKPVVRKVRRARVQRRVSAFK